MIFNEHSNLTGKHALYSASQHSWLNYDENKMVERYLKSFIPTMGTVIHDYARQRITHNIKMSKSDRNAILNYLLENSIPRGIIDIPKILDTLVPYVNDAIGFKMTPEVILYYSGNFFGTTDAIHYDEKEKFLRIHDLKTGDIPAHFEQLEIYAALFCMEYHINPGKINSELRIYQSGEVNIYEPSPDDIYSIIDKIEKMDTIINRIKIEGGV